MSKHKIKYDNTLLVETINKYKSKLIGNYSKINRDTAITFECNCGEIYTKVFRVIVEQSGALCKKHTEEIKLNKRKKTTTEKYGCENIAQVNIIKDKIKQTNIEKYGCDNPSKNIDIINKIKDTQFTKYGSYATQNESVKHKIKSTNITKYGCINPSQSSLIREKINATIMNKYGCNNVFQSEEIKAKIQQTNIEKYGVSFPLQNELIYQQVKQTNIEKYGCENPNQNEQIKLKKKQNSIEKYGVEYPQQSPIIQEKIQKNTYKYKEYTMPSGNKRKVQGYEDFALDDLLPTYTEEQIKTDRRDIPRISYNDGLKIRYYFPDMFIPHENKLIEVKSEWTYQKDEDIIMKKMEAVKNLGYNFELRIYSQNGEMLFYI